MTAPGKDVATVHTKETELDAARRDERAQRRVEIAEREVAELKADALEPFFSHDQKALIKRTIVQDEDLTDDEFAVFIAIAERRKLDPLAKQVHAVKRSGKMAIQTGIDGFRLLASRSGEHLSTSLPEFVGELTITEAADYDGVVKELDEPIVVPLICRVVVERYNAASGKTGEFPAEAYWNEYYPGDGSIGFFWRKMPHGQLAKVAEALALRRGFPAECSGIYTDDEMAQADSSKAGTRERRPGNDGNSSKKVVDAVPFGRDKGKKFTEMGDEHLTNLRQWCDEHAKKDVAEGINAELERRKSAATVTAQDTDSDEAAEEERIRRDEELEMEFEKRRAEAKDKLEGAR